MLGAQANDEADSGGGLHANVAETTLIRKGVQHGREHATQGLYEGSREESACAACDGISAPVRLTSRSARWRSGASACERAAKTGLNAARLGRAATAYALEHLQGRVHAYGCVCTCVSTCGHASEGVRARILVRMHVRVDVAWMEACVSHLRLRLHARTVRTCIPL
eukprot:6167558-Pleurochrysis_carterae.AAC.2